ncbi:MAG: hypothetical protein GX915_10070 [Clostridiales bacterium]|nr:hypothetical protein [Clostridiales bacterium]
MADCLSIITYEAAKHCLSEYEYALIYLNDEVILGKARELKNKISVALDSCKLMEARFFSHDKELHIFERNNQWSCVITRGVNTPSVTKEYKLSEGFGKGKSILVRESLDYDEDGQVYVAKTALSGIKEV